MDARRKHTLGDGAAPADADAPHAAKKRVPSYKVRKEEAEELHAEVSALEAQLLVLQKRLGALDATGSALDASWAKAELQNAHLRRAITCQQLALASTQSMMSQCIVRVNRRRYCWRKETDARGGERRRTSTATPCVRACTCRGIATAAGRRSWH